MTSITLFRVKTRFEGVRTVKNGYFSLYQVEGAEFEPRSQAELSETIESKGCSL